MLVAISDITLSAISKRKKVSTVIKAVKQEPYFWPEIECFCRAFCTHYPDIKRITMTVADTALQVTITVPEFQYTIERSR